MMIKSFPIYAHMHKPLDSISIISCLYTSVLLLALLAQTQQDTMHTRIMMQPTMIINPAAADTALIIMIVVSLSDDAGLEVGEDVGIRTEVGSAEGSVAKGKMMPETERQR